MGSTLDPMFTFDPKSCLLALTHLKVSCRR